LLKDFINQRIKQNARYEMEQKTTTVTSPQRAYALDALRGFAILAMVLSGTISYKILPAWMYHAQEPPPTHTFHPHLPGLTWVDLVFPLFLFSMGAAIPLALSSRLTQGYTIKQVFLYIPKRGFLLGVFAIFLQHLRPFTINQNPTKATWWIALLGFLLLFLIFVRLSVNLKFKQYIKWIPFGASLAAILLVSFLRYPDGSGFSLLRSDIILIVLANMAMFGSLAWFFTKKNLLLRLGLLGLLIALRLSSTVTESWIAVLWKTSPAPWIFQFDYLKYLFIVIPGTLAGDLILNWLQTSILHQENDTIKFTWNQPRFYTIIILMLALCLGLLIGLQARWVWQTTLLSAVLGVIGWFLFVNPSHDTEKLLQSFYQWGIYWLALGLLFEPFEKGIKKDPSTLSYYFVTTAIALFLLIIFTILLEIFQHQKTLQLFIDNGQNPMIAYVAFANFLLPILRLTHLESLILKFTQTPFTGFLKGVLYTLTIAWFVSLLTKLKLLWRT
jgi:predicted acyltransferase